MLLTLSDATDMAAELHLPDVDDNLFQRIIRNPHIEATNPRERECTEMLCAVLCNTIILRNLLFSWFADLSETKIHDFDSFTFVIDTEGSIGNKRDDLRIEGWREYAGQLRQDLLWTIEVKVGANFHVSSLIEDVTNLESDDEIVNQIVNYDRWLASQAVPHKAGFVLALSDKSDSLPKGLRCSWQCFSWTALGHKLQESLQSGSLPANDEFLAKHMLGFIINHLWKESEMSDFDISFDDIALVRAFNTIGRDCEDKINKLVERLDGVLRQKKIGFGKIYHQKSLYKASLRSTVYRNVCDPKVSAHPLLWAGVSNARIAIWLDTPGGSNKKSTINTVINSRLTQLHERNPLWKVYEDHPWVDLELSIPFASLLATDDQALEFETFFRAAIDDLLETGLIEELQTTFSIQSE